MNLIEEEQILIKDIFDVSVSQGSKYSQGTFLLKDFPNQIKNLGNKVSLVQHKTYYDSLLMERLQAPGTQIIAYLEDCLNRSHYAIEKPWNQNELNQKFINYSIEIVKNFLYLGVTQPEIFPQQLQIDRAATQNNDKMTSVAMKLLSHFERRGFNMQILETVYPKINQQEGGNFAVNFLEVLMARQRFQTVIDAKAFFYLTILESICQNNQFKITFFNLPKAPFIPAPLDKLKGSMLDNQSPFGCFVRQSILGHTPSPYHQQIQAMKRFDERMMQQFGTDKLNRQRIKYYTNLQIQFYSKITDVFKVFLKKETQKKFLEWLYACVIGNLKRTKLGSRLQNAVNSNESHDGLTINVFVCLLNLCKGFLTRQTETYKKINPEYFLSSSRMAQCKYQPLKKRQGKELKHMDEQKQFGTVTQFFFLCFQMLYIGFIPSQDNMIQLYEKKQRYQKEKHKFPQGGYQRNIIDKEIIKMQSMMVRYYILIFDDAVIHSSIKLFNMFLFLLPRWLGFDYQNLRGGRIANYQPTQLIYCIPQHFIDSISKFHFNSFRFKQNYLNLCTVQHIHQIIKLTCLLLSQVQVTSNPYLTANFVQLLFYFLQGEKSGIMYEVFKSNLVAHTNLSIGLVRFYCDIAVTGASHQFYTKFKYRFFVNKIFSALWVHQEYRFDLKKIFQTDVYQRFINQMMADTTYCLDEANQAYQQFKALQKKKEQGIKLTPEEQKTEQQTQSRIHGSINQAISSNVRVIRDLSQWSPETFLSGPSLSTIVPLLNNLVFTFIQPTCFVANRQLVAKFKFQKELVFSQVIQIYCNLNIDENLSHQVIKDKRCYRREYFTKALQKASNEHYTDIATLENFEALLVYLAKIANQATEEDEQQVFGQIPEKYQCALMGTLMKDPVELPTSGNVVDRVYIHKHLLNDERDPFNRFPLKYKQVVQRTDLKQEIEDWKKKRLQQLKGADKQLKYGKIGANKKQEQENSFSDKIMKMDDEQ